MRPLALALLAALAAGPALGSAWTLPAGEGFAAQTVAWTRSSEAWDAAGRLRPAPDTETWETRTYLEYGLRDGLTAVAQLSVSHETVGEPTPDLRLGLDWADLGLRLRLGQWRGAVFAAQGTVRLPGAWGEVRPATLGATEPEFDSRLLAGRGWQALGLSGWLDLQAAHRLRTGPEADELRLDLTAGLRPLPRLMVIAQAFGRVAVEGGERDAKLGLSAAWEATPTWTVQLGAGITAWGRVATRETTAHLAIWRKF